MPVARFVKQEAEKAVTSEAESRQENIWKVAVKEEVTSPLPTAGRSLNLSKTSKDHKNKKQRRKEPLFAIILSPHLAQNAARVDSHMPIKATGTLKDATRYAVRFGFLIILVGHSRDCFCGRYFLKSEVQCVDEVSISRL